MRVIIVRSSRTMSIGSRVRWASADVPLPKPSSATCTPISRSELMSSPVRSSSALAVDVVTCSTSRSGARPELRSACSTSATSVPVAT